MLAGIAVSLFGILIFLFLFWRRLREDYAAEIIFNAATYILIGIGIGLVFSFRFFPIWFFWASITGGLIGLSLTILKFKLKFYETLEAFIIASLPWLSLIFLKDSVVKSSLSSFLAFLATLITVFLSYFFDTEYKKFNWYKSGRVGFAGLATVILIFLLRFTIAIVKVPVLSFVGQAEASISGVLVVVSLLLLYNLGRKRV
jgi:hypothetical protein